MAGVLISMKAIANSRCASGLSPTPIRGDPEPPSFCDLHKAGGLVRARKRTELQSVPPGGSQGGSPVAKQAVSVYARIVMLHQVPPNVRRMYAAVAGEPFPVRASRMDLVPERYWRQDVADLTGEVPGSVVVDTRERFLYHVKAGGLATRYRPRRLCMVG